MSGARIESLAVSAYTVPTDAPEADGTLRWDSTTIVLVEAAAGGERGLGYTYGDLSTGKLIESKLAGAVQGQDAMRVQSCWAAMQRALRNAGRTGIGAMAVAAVDTALWDLKARLLKIPLADLLGRFNEGVPVYGSGGFTSYSVERLWEQVEADPGIPVTVDLVERTVSVGTLTVPFDIDDYTRWRLLEGLDDISLTLAHEADISAYEADRPSWKPATL